ncbi:hypothetical protein [Sphingomonas corticis]|jgi:hypothetical protein|uniref:Uncharacterized protein n=1 Tax=Sphingomonas corticis TaxID=2722791 RepID=A0ABX1CVB4_9SPHN|nr:hypothetical protein [Sphingomonas corticis]NJR80230.1 hypothetical protein [Sphingomonas corticis]
MGGVTPSRSPAQAGAQALSGNAPSSFARSREDAKKVRSRGGAEARCWFARGHHAHRIIERLLPQSPFFSASPRLRVNRATFASSRLRVN